MLWRQMDAAQGITDSNLVEGKTNGWSQEQFVERLTSTVHHWDGASDPGFLADGEAAGVVYNLRSDGVDEFGDPLSHPMCSSTLG